MKAGLRQFFLFLCLFNFIIFFAPLRGWSQVPPPVLCESSAILGSWQWHEFIFEGGRYPITNPDLVLIFDFFSNGQNRLFWQRKGQTGFCERRGTYTFEDCRLTDTVTWINPDNNPDCGLDPDMQLGKKAISKLEIMNKEMHLHLDFSGTPLIYIWKSKSQDK